MKKILLFLALLAFLATPAFASVGLQYANAPIGTATDINIPTGQSYTFDGSTLTLSLAGAAAAITSGTISGTAINSSTIGVTTPLAGKFTTLEATGSATMDTTLGVTGITTLTGALKANGGIDLTVAGALAIGASTATSVVITPATTITGILTQTGRLNANGGIDVTSAGALNLGATTATSVVITPATTITGILTQTGRLNANGGIDTTTAIPLLLGANTASAVTITPATTVTGALTASTTLGVTGVSTFTGRANANGGIDTTTAIPLTFGSATATAVNITPPTNITGATAITGALTLGSTLVSPGTASYGTYTLRTRVPIASVNSGVTLLAAISGRKIRIVDCYLIAYGGAVTSTTATGVKLVGYQSGSVSLFVVAKAQLTQSALNRFGTGSTTLLADGASTMANDANQAITFIANGGSDLAGATGIDVILTYSIE